MAVLADRGAEPYRVFRRADLPAAILEKPDLPLRLSDHYQILGAAARETAEPCFGAVLGLSVRVRDLGEYGKWVTSAPTLALCIERANSLLNQMMQTNTDLVLRQEGSGVLWSMVFHTAGHAGRYQNELLALCYLLDTLRVYLGARWQPRLIRVIGNDASRAASLERLFGAPVRGGYESCGIELDPLMLAVSLPTEPNVGLRSLESAEMAMPDNALSTEAILAAIQIDVLGGVPRIGNVARRLATSVRTLQRSLSSQGLSFTMLAGQQQYQHSKWLLRNSGKSVAAIADEMGYSDPAHFSRAFSRWAGVSPQYYRACR